LAGPLPPRSPSPLVDLGKRKSGARESDRAYGAARLGNASRTTSAVTGRKAGKDYRGRPAAVAGPATTTTATEQERGASAPTARGKPAPTPATTVHVRTTGPPGSTGAARARATSCAEGAGACSSTGVDDAVLGTSRRDGLAATTAPTGRPNPGTSRVGAGIGARATATCATHSGRVQPAPASAAANFDHGSRGSSGEIDAGSATTTTTVHIRAVSPDSAYRTSDAAGATCAPAPGAVSRLSAAADDHSEGGGDRAEGDAYGPGDTAPSPGGGAVSGTGVGTPAASTGTAHREAE
jgi:hypothetical protein